MYKISIFLGCHIAVVSSIVRLSKGVLFNILQMPRVDSSYFAQKWQKNGKTFYSYFEYLIIIITHSRILRNPTNL